MCRSCLSCSLLWRDISFDLEVLLERSYALEHAKKDLIFDRAEQAGTEEQQKQGTRAGQVPWQSPGSAKSPDHWTRPWWWGRYEAKQDIKSAVRMWTGEKRSQPQAQPQPRSASGRQPQCKRSSQKKGGSSRWGFLPLSQTAPKLVRASQATLSNSCAISREPALSIAN